MMIDWNLVWSSFIDLLVIKVYTHLYLWKHLFSFKQFSNKNFFYNFGHLSIILGSYDIIEFPIISWWWFFHDYTLRTIAFITVSILLRRQLEIINRPLNHDALSREKVKFNQTEEQFFITYKMFNHIIWPARILS